MIHVAQKFGESASLLGDTGSGKWIGPVVIFALAFALDYSAIGNNAFRDRIAAGGYYAAALGMIYIYRWQVSIRELLPSDNNWILLGSGFSVLLHAGLVLAMVGSVFKGTSQVSRKIGSTVGIGGKASGENRINTTLLYWSIGTAASLALARGPLGGIALYIGSAITDIWVNIASAFVDGIGG
jgi:hypothetical protein